MWNQTVKSDKKFKQTNYIYKKKCKGQDLINRKISKYQINKTYKVYQKRSDTAHVVSKCIFTADFRLSNVCLPLTCMTTPRYLVLLWDWEEGSSRDESLRVEYGLLWLMSSRDVEILRIMDCCGWCQSDLRNLGGCFGDLNTKQAAENGIKESNFRIF